MQQATQIETSQAEIILEELNYIIAKVNRLQDQVQLIHDSNQRESDPDYYRPIEEEEFFGMWADREDMKGKTSREWLEEQRRKHWKSQPRRPIEEAECFGMWADREDMKGKTSQEWVDGLRDKQWNRHERETDD